LQPFIQNGTFKNGYQHFIEFGLKDGQFGTSFFETEYLQKNPDVRPFVESGALKTGREHYFNFGKNEPNRSATFVGTSGNDILTSFGVGKVELIGVEVGLYPSNGPVNNVVAESRGSDEFDTLIGGSGRDTFMLSNGYFDFPRLSPVTQQFYIGPGFATIRNFTKGQDSIQLGNKIFLGDSYLDEFSVFPINNNRDLAIQRKGFISTLNGLIPINNGIPDTIAVIEGGGDLTLNQLPSSNTLTFLIG
jgi:hypothetical protein